MPGSWVQHDTIVAQTSRRDVIDLFREGGEALVLDGSQPLLISDGTLAWIVDTGALDLFLVDVINGVPVGRRHHFVRVEQGELLLGVECLPTRSPEVMFGLLAVALNDTRIISIDAETLRARAAKKSALDAVHGLIDNWVRLLSRELHKQDTPQHAKPMNPGANIELEPGDAVSAGPKTIWFHQSEGESRLVGVSPVKPRPDRSLLPLTRETWIVAETKVKLTVVDAATYFRWDPNWQSLRRFHRFILDCLARTRAAEFEGEQKRFASGESTQRATLNNALLQLANVDEVDLLSDVDDPTMNAVRRIGKNAGLKFEAPQNRGASVAIQAEYIARQSRVRQRVVFLREGWWKLSTGPMLASTATEQGAQTPLAILPRPFGGYDVYDAVAKETKKVTKSVAEKILPFAHAFYRPFPARALKWYDLLRFAVVGNYVDFGVMIAAGVILGLLGMAIPLATGYTIDTIIPGAEVGLLLQMGVVLFAIAIATALLQVARTTAAIRLESRMAAETEAAVWDRLLALPVPFFREYSAGDLAVRAQGIDYIRQVLSGGTLNTLLTAFFSLMNFFVMLGYDTKLAGVAILLALGNIAIAIAVGLANVVFHRHLAASEGKLSSVVLQLLGGITKLRIAGAERRAFGQWAKAFVDKRTQTIKVRRLNNVMSVIHAFYPTLMTVVVFALVAGASREGRMTTGEFVAFNAAFGIFVYGLTTLVGQAVELLTIVPIWERARPLLETVPEVDDFKADPGPLRGEIQVSHVSFRYSPGGALTLDDVDFTISQGQMVAIVGASAAGKSTLFRMMLGFEKPESGGIFFDRQELASLDVTAVRRQMGVVLQNGQPIAGSILENIIGSRNLTLDRAMEAIREAGLEDDIKRMPMGVHTVLGQGGMSLSGGQRQRLLIARAIATKPRIIFFDEATSALDNNAQALVTESLEKLQATRVVIAHRLSTIKNADKIIVLERGRVVESGTYEQLMKQDGVFKAIARRQIA